MKKIVQLLGRAYPAAFVKTCPKVGHSCYRNIVSFQAVQGRAAMRLAARALVHLVLQHVQHWAVSSLATAPAEVHNAVNALADSPSNRKCVVCQHVMAGPTLRVYDAGQAYEVLDPRVVQSYLDVLFQIASDEGANMVQVMKALKAITGKSPNVPSRPP